MKFNNTKKKLFFFFQALLLILLCNFEYATGFQQATTSIKRLTTELPAASPKVNNNNNERETKDVLPFIIEQVDPEQIEDFRDISSMCIDVFFDAEANDPLVEKKTGISSLWKSVKLNYLKNMQYSDLRMVKFTPSSMRSMFVAKAAEPVPAVKYNDDVIHDLSSIYNSEYLSGGETDFFKPGKIIGFCQITARQFDLEPPSLSTEKKKNSSKRKLYPILTNLAVEASARKSGVGSQLLSCAEEAVTQQWNPPYRELVLQVEDDNPNAIQFYKRRGFKELFADPNTSRYDTSGVFLRKEQSTKLCMRKELGTSLSAPGVKNMFDFKKLLQLFNN